MDALAHFDAILDGCADPPLYMVFVYYARNSNAIGAGSSELYSTADSEAEAIADAERASVEMPEHELAVEGGRFEPGGWENPVFRAGQRIR